MHKIDPPGGKKTQEKIDKRPYVQNNSDKDVLLKPGWDNGPTTDIDGTVKAENGAYVLKPGHKTHIDIDGVNVNGEVYKVTDGYTKVTINENGKVIMDYSKSNFYQATKALLFGGKIEFSDIPKDARNWDAIFQIKK
jgi:hypothetical protein